MITVNHAIAGALIAVAVNDPLIAVPVAFLSHFAMDVLPHFMIQVKNGNVYERNNRLLFKIVTRTDVVLTIVVLLSLPIILQHHAAWGTVLACSLAAAGPDIAWVYRFLGEQKTGKLAPKNRFNQFHKNIQWAEYPWALPFDLTWLGISIGVVLKVVS